MSLIKFPLRLLTNLYKFFKRLSWKKKVLTFILVLVVIFIANSLLHHATKGSQYETEAARYDSITEVVSETGNITSTGAIPVYSTSTGLVEAVYVQNGDTVTKDAKLFKVVSSANKQEKDTALSNYLAAKTTYETSKATELSLQATMFSQWDSFKTLAEGDNYEDADGNPKTAERNVAQFMVPERQWLASEANYKKQATAVSQASAALGAAWQAYQATQNSETTAVLAGKIENLSLGPGDAVVAPTSLTLSSTVPALILYDSDARTLAKIELGETDAIKVQAGQPATIQLDALPNHTFSGHVDRVDSFTTPTGGVVDYSVYIVLDNPDPSIKGGMTADIDITVATKDHVLTVPTSAVKPYQGGRAVRVVGAKGEVEYLPVETGSKGADRIEIISGINEGQQIITALKNNQVERKSSGGLFQ